MTSAEYTKLAVHHVSPSQTLYPCYMEAAAPRRVFGVEAEHPATLQGCLGDKGPRIQ